MPPSPPPFRPPHAAKAGLAVVAALLVWAGLAWALQGELSLASLQAGHAWLLRAHAQAPGLFVACWFSLFVVLSALALPGAAVLALLAGSLWGLLLGTALVLLASTLGATVSFLAARHWWRQPLQQRFGARLAALDAALARQGAWHLLALRLAPVIPYGLLNPLMGLTSMPTLTYFGVSALGMLAGTLAYVYAGCTLASLQSLSGLFQPEVMAALAVLALLPWLLRSLSRRWGAR